MRNFHLARDRPTISWLPNYRTSDELTHELWYFQKRGVFRLRLCPWKDTDHWRWLFLHSTLLPTCTHEQKLDRIWRKDRDIQNISGKSSSTWLLFIQWKEPIWPATGIKIQSSKVSWVFWVCHFRAASWSLVLCRDQLRNNRDTKKEASFVRKWLFCSLKESMIHTLKQIDCKHHGKKIWYFQWFWPLKPF